MISAIAIDDEPVALEVVRSHAAKVSFIELKSVFTNAFDALAYLQENPVDLLFLDIKMPDISGIDFLSCLKTRPMVVFTTAYSEHAVKSFELDAIDYLLKPFSLSRFLKACNKAYELHLLRNRTGQNEHTNFVFFKDGYEQIKVLLNDILFVEAAGNYCKVFLANQKTICTRISLSDMLLLLPTRNFVRTHRAFIISVNKVTKYDRSQVFIEKYTIPIGATYTQCVNEFVK